MFDAQAVLEVKLPFAVELKEEYTTIPRWKTRSFAQALVWLVPFVVR